MILDDSALCRVLTISNKLITIYRNIRLMSTPWCARLDEYKRSHLICVEH